MTNKGIKTENKILENSSRVAWQSNLQGLITPDKDRKWLNTNLNINGQVHRYEYSYGLEFIWKFYYTLLRHLAHGLIITDSCVHTNVSVAPPLHIVNYDPDGECCPCHWQPTGGWSEELSSWQGRGILVDPIVSLVLRCQLLNSATTKTGARKVNKRKTFWWASAIQTGGTLPTCWGLRHVSHESSEWFSLTFPVWCSLAND